MFFAILNGSIRELLISPRLGENAGHVISSILLIILILIGTYYYLKYWLENYIKKDLIVIGSIWLVLTIGFEFIFGYYVTERTWQTLLAEYNLFAGRLWTLILLVTLTAPWLVAKFLRR